MAANWFQCSIPFSKILHEHLAPASLSGNSDFPFRLKKRLCMLDGCEKSMTYKDIDVVMFTL